MNYEQKILVRKCSFANIMCKIEISKTIRTWKPERDQSNALVQSKCLFFSHSSLNFRSDNIYGQFKNIQMSARMIMQRRRIAKNNDLLNDKELFFKSQRFCNLYFTNYIKSLFCKMKIRFNLPCEQFLVEYF